ncbi:MAG: hypothetical protein ACMUIU_15130 [bacterium]
MKWKPIEYINGLKTKLFPVNKAEFIKRYAYIIFLLFLAVLINYCGKGAGPIEGTPDDSEGLEFIGTGVNITEAFKSNGGATVFEIQHDGASNFTVRLLDYDTGEEISLLANNSGFINVRVTKILFPKNYILEVDADGNWIIVVSGNIEKVTVQPSETKMFFGKGLHITEDFQISGGLTIFEMQHDGGSDFIVWLLNSNTNEKISLLVNKSGFFYGTVAEGLESGYYKLEIEADGIWLINVSGNII